MIIVADNLQVTNPDVAEAISSRNPEPLEKRVKACIEAGADAIDINPGPLKKNAGEIMTFLVQTVRGVTANTILLDTTSAPAIEAGLAAAKGRAVINGFSLEPEKLAHILPLAKRFDADIIGYVLYPDSRVPTDEAEFMEITLELLAEAEKAGINPEKLIIDPVVAPLIWENGVAHNRSLLSFLGRLPDLAGYPLRSVAGLSNLTTGRGASMEKKRLAERTFLPMMAAAGLSLVLMQVFHKEVVDTARVCEALTSARTIFSWSSLTAL